MAPRIRSLTVKGFRAFGAAEQTLNLPADITAVWGPNSKGKTSLAEAVEFLLTGGISRRQLMASSQDEFADALRNAHLRAGEDVYVWARILTADGTTHVVRRTLTRDYAKRQDCESRLEIDGASASEADLARLGIALSQPPLQAPILAQHTLSYIFSVRPQDRATYFKTLLEVTDLDEVRNDIAALADQLTAPDDPHLKSFDNCRNRPIVKDHLGRLPPVLPALPALSERVSQAIGGLIEHMGEVAPDTLAERADFLETRLADLRSKTFPVGEFRRQPLPAWRAPAADIWTRLQTFIDEREQVDEETQRLSGLFKEALKLPEISGLAEPTQCVLCGTEAALTPERVQLIRRYVEYASGFGATEAAAKTALSQLSALAQNLQQDVELTLPQFLKRSAADRRSQGFTVARLRELLGDQADELLAPWLAAILPLARASARFRRAVQAIAAKTTRQTADMATLDPADLRRDFDDLIPLHDLLLSRLQTYEDQAQLLVSALKEVLDEAAETAGWEDLINVARNPDKLRVALIEREACERVAKELATTVKQIDKAKEEVLQDKFADYSGMIGKWWEALRPDEPTFFTAVKPRKGAKRTIDFKAGLSPEPDRSAPKVRDVIAVFSQSQLHCLGLALFLARAEHEGSGFIVLDDPVLSSDEDYRVHFNTTVLSGLLAIPMQVVILTQDHATWEELETRYRHLGISIAQLYLETPAEGSVIENTSDALLAKISRAKSLARGGHPDSRKECGIQLRDAGERFCKEMLVQAERQKGNTAAALSDYDEKTLEWLCPRVEPLLDQDPSHPGKLQAFKNTVNDACHDNVPPSTGAMTHACGEIGYLQKEYLPR